MASDNAFSPPLDYAETEEMFRRNPNVTVGLIVEILKQGSDSNDRGGIVLGVCKLRDPLPKVHADSWCCDAWCWTASDQPGGGVDAVNGLIALDCFNKASDHPVSAQISDPTLAQAYRVRPGTMRLARMVEQMRASRIRPAIWDGEKAVYI